MSHDVRIVPALPCHVPRIAENARKADEVELWAAACKSPADVMNQALDKSVLAWTGFIDGNPVCMFGVTPGAPLSGCGIPWMVGTRHLDRYAVLFLRRCRPVVEEMLSHFDLLHNYVDSRNVRAVRWLKWLGFEMSEPKPYGPFGVPFHAFQMKEINHV